MVENDLYRITFTNKGAQVKSWVLKKFNDDQGHPLELVNSRAQVESQQDGQTVMQPSPEKYGYPMSLWTYDGGLRSRLNSGLYLASSTGDLRTPADLTFEYSDGDLLVRKTFHFDESYLVKLETEVTHSGQSVPAYTAWPAGFGDQTIPASYAAAHVVYQTADKVNRLKKVSGGSTIGSPFNWAGAVDQYFGAVFLPDQPDSATMVTLSSAAAIPKNPGTPDWKETTPVNLIGVAVGNVNGPTSGRWFVGPKAVNVIDNIWSRPISGQATGPNLGGVVDFGFFGCRRQTPVPLAEMDAGQIVCKSQGSLGLGHRHFDHRHQPGFAAVAHHQHEVGAENAEDSAAGRGNQKQVQERADE